MKSESLSVIQEKMPSGTFEENHFHSNSQQLFYILSGVATFQIDGQMSILETNQSIHILNGTTHFISNNADQPLEFLVISEPHAHGDRYNL